MKTATRITTTRTTSLQSASSAAISVAFHDDFTFEDLVQAYYDCRKRKRNTASALHFEFNLSENLNRLYHLLESGTYRPGKSLCFVITHPKPREVWAAHFPDRIVHHLLYNKISPRFYANFIADSCACIPERGTLYAAQRLESKIRSATENWSKSAYYLKCDLANFFVSIKKETLREQLARRIHEPWWMQLAELILFHDPRENYQFRGDPRTLDLVPTHKRLINQPANQGLPIGNLSSQFFANVLLNDLDQRIKHKCRAKHYVRYVDDFIIIHKSAQWLNDVHDQINEFLPSIGVALNPSKTILQPVDRGVDFVGHVIKPWRRTTRRKTVTHAIKKIREAKPEELRDTANSYLGLLRQASHSRHDRTQLTKEILRRGRAVDYQMTKTFKGLAI